MSTVTTTVDDGIATLTLNRPGVLNAFTLDMGADFVDALRGLDADAAVRAIIVTGAGRAFCAGMELSDSDNVFGFDPRMDLTPAELAERWQEPEVSDGAREPGGKLTLAILECRKPVIAAINGPAVGIGSTMTLPMDFRLASTHARMGFVFARLGITPEACSTWFLPRLIGVPSALELLYTGDIIDAARAHEVGLVGSVHEPDELLPAAHALADRLTRGRSPHAVALTRQLVYRHLADVGVLEAHLDESLALRHAAHGDGREGGLAFLAKREPHFNQPAPHGFDHIFLRA
ncbi:enoyl-CoA hydratase-related protein [Tessaracoccus palaemonis]|uniref:Enoyl-CoA hydratase/isomerase family protein n=1 Tax=Tessaracoccus palaemonis TaxID=2829499 RepID=A0ABX8SGA0_9ACTN|nr:enoyl-CoA hydratase-related protein [Tessaracoccus palaemonis]QXT62300.1 enoyl-CoA hydratase/isomerase family protein [Tessaracoccus palaemonis]